MHLIEQHCQILSPTAIGETMAPSSLCLFSGIPICNKISMNDRIPLQTTSQQCFTWLHLLLFLPQAPHWWIFLYWWCSQHFPINHILITFWHGGLGRILWHHPQAWAGTWGSDPTPHWPFSSNHSHWQYCHINVYSHSPYVLNKVHQNQHFPCNSLAGSISSRLPWVSLM